MWRLSAIAGLAAIGALCGCSDSGRYLIANKAPFYEAEVPYAEGHADDVIKAVQSFSQRHHMHFLLAHQSLGPDEFNASANTPSLNLKAIHVRTMSKGVLIYAIARGEPTAADRARVEAFATEVRRRAAASP